MQIYASNIHPTPTPNMAACSTSSSSHALLPRGIRSPLPRFLPQSLYITPPISAYRHSTSISSLRLTARSPIRQSYTFQASSSMADNQYKGHGKSISNVFPSEEDLAVSLAKYVADLSHKFTSERGAFTVVVSGGSLIQSLRKLTEAPYASSVDWSRWHVFWVDERVVPKDHADSNYKLAYDGFLSKVPIPPGNVYAINDALSAEGAAEDYETCLKRLVKTGVIATSEASGFPKFDLQLLGMGPDGHVASMFPGHPLLQEKKKWVTFIKDSPKPPPERITFTFPVINSGAYIANLQWWSVGLVKLGPLQLPLVINRLMYPSQFRWSRLKVNWHGSLTRVPRQRSKPTEPLRDLKPVWPGFWG